MSDFDVGYEDIIGGFGAGNVTDIMNYLMQTLGSAGYGNVDYSMEQNTSNPFGGTYGWGSYEQSGGGQNWEDFTSWLQGAESGAEGYSGIGSGAAGTLQELGAALEGIDMPNLQEQYASGVSDITGGYKSGMQNLKKAQGIGSKGGRYGGIASGGKYGGKKGGRKQYMSDYYDLTSNYQSGMQGLQEGLEGSFEDALAQYMTFNPTTDV